MGAPMLQYLKPVVVRGGKGAAMPELSGELFTPAEVASFLYISQDVVDLWIGLHTLPSFSTPNGRRIRRVDLLGFLEPLIEPADLDAVCGRGRATVPHEIEEMASERFELESRTLPLFHYTKAATALEHILADRQLRLGPPVDTNDPFESEPYSIALTGGPLPVDTMMGLIELAGRLFRDRCRLTCFTRSGPNSWSSKPEFGNGFMRARMWAQYADNHKGICLAFDQSRLIEAVKACQRPGTRVYKAPVRYRGEEQRELTLQLPSDQLLDRADELATRLFPSVVSGLYFSKAWDWASESEYRLVVEGEVNDFEYLDISEALTGVFCGWRVSDGMVDGVCRLCPELFDVGRVYQLRWQNGFPYAQPVLDHA
jgi:hypothetical protein